MANGSPPLYLDEDVSVVVAAILRARGFRAITARAAGRLGRTDAEQLAFAAEARYALVTHNRADFELLHWTWLESGRAHAGILIARLRRPGELASRIGRLLSRLPSEQFTNQLFYL